MSAAAALLAEAGAAGVRLRLTAEGRVAAVGTAPPGLIARLRERKGELAGLLRGGAPGPAAPVPLDAAGLPSAPCPACAGGAFHAAPGGPWRCSGCEPPDLPPAEALAGWMFCDVPVSRELAAAARALSPEAMSDPAELCVRGEMA